MNIRLATYNIHKFFGGDGKRDEARTLAIIKSLNADILALQGFVLQDHSENIAMVENFAAKVGYHFIAQPMLHAKGMVQFNLLLTRKAVTSQNLVTLPHEGKEARGTINAFLYFEGKIIQIAATHLGLTPTARNRQLKTILDLGSHQDRMPFALLGDLNIMLRWEAARIHLEKEFFCRQKKVASFPAHLPILAFDSIYVRPAEMIQSVRAFTEGLVRSASDHLPIVADISLT